MPPVVSIGLTPPHSPMLWFYNLPTWLFALLATITAVGLALLCLAFVHPRLHRSPMAALVNNETVGSFFSAVTVLYGLLLGLLTVATWQNFTQTSGLASREAAQLAVLYRDLAGYETAQQLPLRAQLRRYTLHIVQRSWPRQRQGLIDDEESAQFIRLQTLLFGYDPHTIAHQLIHQQALQVFNNLAELRRLRAEAISGGVPAVIWWVVLVGAVLTLICASLFRVDSYWFHGLLSGVLGATIGLLIFLIAALDHPYWGEVSVDTKAYELVLQKVMLLR